MIYLWTGFPEGSLQLDSSDHSPQHHAGREEIHSCLFVYQQILNFDLIVENSSMNVSGTTAGHPEHPPSQSIILRSGPWLCLTTGLYTAHEGYEDIRSGLHQRSILQVSCTCLNIVSAITSSIWPAGGSCVPIVMRIEIVEMIPLILSIQNISIDWKRFYLEYCPFKCHFFKTLFSFIILMD